MTDSKAEHRICKHCGKEILLAKGMWIAWEQPRSRFCGLADASRKHEPR